MRLAGRIRHKLDHRLARRRAFDYLDGELGKRHRRRLRAHAERCVECEAALRALTILLWELRDLSAPGPMQSIVAGVLGRLRQELAMPGQSPLPAVPAVSERSGSPRESRASARGWQAVAHEASRDENGWRVMGSPSATDEQQLIERAQDGEQSAFEELVRRHADRLYAVLLRYVADAGEAEELTQEAFLRAWRGIRGFEGRSQFFTWLYRIAINEAKRRAERRPAAATLSSLEDQPLDDAPDWSEAPALRAEQGELRRVLEESVRALPVDYRTPLILRDIEGLSTEEAAEIMGLGEEAFKSRLHRARLAVRRAIDDYFVEVQR